jgi:hypothetical protein
METGLVQQYRVMQERYNHFNLHASFSLLMLQLYLLKLGMTKTVRLKVQNRFINVLAKVSYAVEKKWVSEICHKFCSQVQGS